jgi:diadenosine tetraphosphatase ApaH/serine/threonine PP2A family protein phosphatase
MRIALLSDIHSNLQALEATLAHARQQQVQHFMVLGDLVGYGANPSEVVARIQQLTEEEGAEVLQGNHDTMAVQPPAESTTVGDATALWTHRQLSQAQRDWLQALPLTRQNGEVLFVHASADQPAQWNYVYDARAATASLDAASQWPGVRYVFGGHVHNQSLYYRGSTGGLVTFKPQPHVAIPVPNRRQWLGTIGSVGQPRDGQPRCMYAVLDMKRALLTFYRVSYDHKSAAQAIRKAGLPEFFASRLESGR